jgi:YD repeat-containing protein
MDYGYDALNHVSSATDNRRVHTTTYNFDDVGNLKDCTYGNGVVHTWTYDALNRLTNVTAGGWHRSN